MPTSKTTRLTRLDLERLAVDAHLAGDTWAEFWNRHWGDIAMIEPQDDPGHDKFVRRLFALVVASDCDGQRPAGDGGPCPCPWEVGDQAGDQACDQAEPVPVISDTETAARCLWKPAAGCVGSDLRGDSLQGPKHRPKGRSGQVAPPSEEIQV